MDNVNNFCVYFHFNKKTDEVFYVGIGTGYRPKRFSQRNDIWHRIVEKYGFYYKIIHENLTWDEACGYEKKYISEFGRRNNKTGRLANMTDGGDGTPGCKWNVGKKRTKEQRERISNSLKGRKIPKDIVQKAVIAKMSKRKEKISNGIAIPKRKLSDKELLRVRTMNIGRTLSEDTRRKISEKLKGRIPTEEHRRKNSESNTGKIVSIETRAKISEIVKQQWRDKRTWLYK